MTAWRKLAAVGAVLALLTWSGGTQATDNFYVVLDLSSGFSDADMYKFRVFSSNTQYVSQNKCRSEGEWDLEYPSVSLDPPFSGSASKSSFVTICNDKGWMHIHLTISQSGCTMWICNASFSYRIDDVHDLNILEKPDMELYKTGREIHVYINAPGEHL